MAVFKFRYEAIKKTKELQEELLTTKLAAIESQISSLIQEINNLNEQKIRLKNNLISQKNIKASDAQLFQKYEADLNLKIKMLKNNIIDLEADKKKIMKQLIEKSKEIKVFETLKENDKIEFFRHLDKIEQKFLDDLSNSKNSELKIWKLNYFI